MINNIDSIQRYYLWFYSTTFPVRAPFGCLQYFTEDTGTIESFNFGHLLENMDYTVCIKDNEGAHLFIVNIQKQFKMQLDTFLNIK